MKQLLGSGSEALQVVPAPSDTRRNLAPLQPCSSTIFLSVSDGEDATCSAAKLLGFVAQQVALCYSKYQRGQVALELAPPLSICEEEGGQQWLGEGCGAALCRMEPGAFALPDAP